MTETLAMRPAFTDAEAVELLEAHYQIRGTLGPLPSERDQNFLVKTDDGRRLVLKIANAGAERDELEAQNQMMDRLQATGAVGCPTVLPSTAGLDVTAVEGDEGQRHWARLLTWIDAVPLADFTSRSPALLRSVGRFLGRLDRALVSFDHPAAHREFYWDAMRGPTVISDRLDAVPPGDRHDALEAVVSLFQERVERRGSELRWQVLHNDGNDHNLLVAGDPVPAPGVVGIIDFGDFVYTALPCEVAVGAAYALLGSQTPLEDAAEVVTGYHDEMPLTEAEVAVLFPLMCTRLAVSVTVAAAQTRDVPNDTYLAVSEQPAWNALARLGGIDPDFALYTFRGACGMAPCPTASVVVDWIAGNSDSFAPVLGPAIDIRRSLVLDLGPGSETIDALEDLTNAPLWTAKVQTLLSDADATVGIGRYDEPRLCYTGEQFATVAGERRTIHIGMDLFAQAGTPVHAPLAGRVHSFADNDRDLDYGPTIVLEHAPTEHVRFHTLYGHLRGDSLSGLAVGDAVPAGKRIGWIGDFPENGNWPPHLHLQLITDMTGHRGDFPGVAPAGSRALWTSLSPDPSVLVGVTGASGPASGRTKKDILDARREHAGPSLSIAYHEPLEIVRGAGQFLYDDLGHAYLDCVNNVCHVGHCHPRVVAAAARQMAILNTNTRYLHGTIVEYLKRLTATLPEPLSVCYLVCSGSEANELALRLAQAHTGGDEFIVIDHAYHGNTARLVDLSPYKHDGPGGKGAPSYVHPVQMPDPYRGPHRSGDAGARYAEDVSRTVRELRERGRQVAAFIAESALGCGGQVVLPDGYLARAAATVREAGGVFIADEVQVGFGRAGSAFWMFETQDVIPDIVTMGKPIGNGHPLGAVVTTPEIAASFDNGMEYFNTFGGNPVSCAAGLAVLDVIRDEGLQARAAAVGEHFLTGMRALTDRHEVIGDVRGQGLFLGVELVRDRETRAPADREASYVVERMKDAGILLSTDGPFHNVLKIKPPMVFTEADAARVVATLDRVLSELVAGA